MPRTPLSALSTVISLCAISLLAFLKGGPFYTSQGLGPRYRHNGRLRADAQGIAECPNVIFEQRRVDKRLPLTISSSKSHVLSMPTNQGRWALGCSLKPIPRQEGLEVYGIRYTVYRIPYTVYQCNCPCAFVRNPGS